jgi:poly(A)-specific ribonuclease
MPFNFYIYPFVLNNAEDRVFSFSSGSMQFLAENNFDFNRLFYEGIFYVSREERKLYEGQYQLEKIRKVLYEMDRIITPDMKAFLNLHQNRIIEWLKSTSKDDHVIPIRFIKTRTYKHLLKTIR